MFDEVIEPIINFRKVKYDKLDEMIVPLIKNNTLTGEFVNFYIDLDFVLEKFYDPKVLSCFKSLKGKELIKMTAEVINIISHYRNYFWSRFKVPTAFILYSFNSPISYNKKINNDKYMVDLYNKKSQDHPEYGMVNYVFNVNKKMIENISVYIKNAYYIETFGIDTTVIPYFFINKHGNNSRCNIILTNDKIDYQCAMLKNTFILNACGSKSKLISSSDLIEEKFKNIKYRPNNNFSPELYSIIMASIGYKKRGLEKVTGFSNTCKILDKAISQGIIKNGKNIHLPDELLDMFPDGKLLNANFKLINPDRQLRSLKLHQQSKLYDCLVDRFDNSAIMELNDRYFNLNNIQLIELSKGV